METAVRRFDLETGILLRDDRYRTSLWGFVDGTLELPTDGTHFGFVADGNPRITNSSGGYELSPGMYFSAPGETLLEGEARVLVATRHQYLGFFQLGGPIERTGRLRYIDGCTDSLLVGPVIAGDPCLNLLHFPPGIHQTAHTHPSLRAGIVARGEGRCHLEDETLELREGQPFYIPAETLHNFATTDREMLVIAYHPDSDCGPSHDDHPMINKTEIDGVSARFLDGIRTRGEDP